MKRVAVIAGVNRYDRDPLIRPLLFCDADCTELYGFFKHQAGYDAVQLLRAPCKHDILDTLEEAVSGLKAGDLLVLFFVGHGIEYAGKHLLLCRPARLAWLKHYDEAIPVEHLCELTAKPGLNRILILDSCRSDLLLTRAVGENGLKGEASLRDVVTQVTAPAEQEGSLTILCSCTEGKQALELPQRKQGLFTAALLDVMRENLNQKTELAVNDAFQQSIAERMVTIAKCVGLACEQRPWVQRSGPPPLLLSGHTDAVVAPPLMVHSPSVHKSLIESILEPRIGSAFTWADATCGRLWTWVKDRTGYSSVQLTSGLLAGIFSIFCVVLAFSRHGRRGFFIASGITVGVAVLCIVPRIFHWVISDIDDNITFYRRRYGKDAETYLPLLALAQIVVSCVLVGGAVFGVFALGGWLFGVLG